MKKILSLFFVGFMLLLSSCSNDIYEGICRRDPVVVDGKSNDWMMPLRFSDLKTKLNYNVTNDNENLYFAFRLTDENMIRGFMQSGMQITIDKSGKKKTKPGYAIIKFPVQKRGKQPVDTEHGFDPLPGQENRLVDKTASIPFNVEFKGFKSNYNGTFRSDEKPGVSFSMARDENNYLFCEIVIPFKAFYKDRLTAEDNDKLLGITFTFQFPEERQNQAGMPDGGQARGPGGPGGNGMGGSHSERGGGMPPSDSNDQMQRGKMPQHPDQGGMKNAKLETATVKFRIKMALCK